MKVLKLKIGKVGRFNRRGPNVPLGDVYFCRCETDEGAFESHVPVQQGQNGIFHVEGDPTPEHVAAIVRNFADAIARMGEKQSIAA